jgi:1-deoxy-D-xylulose-5-phosphate reductoisomerase
MIRVGILGSTGFIGRKTLELISEFKDYFKVVGLSCYKNYKLLAKQVKEFSPEKVAIGRKEDFEDFKELLGNKNVKIYVGEDGINEIAKIDTDVILLAISGTNAILPLFHAINEGKRIALANKEALVSGGKFFLKLAKEKNSTIIPIDSEHNAIYQLLRDKNFNYIKKIILTCSGGPLNKMDPSQIEKVTPEIALSHPRWEMGKKITVDSATLMNKGFEIIEAHWLFGIDSKNIDILIHPEAIIHGIIEFIDGSYHALLAYPDMKIPISYALGFSMNLRLNLDKDINWQSFSFNFELPDYDKFPCLKLGYRAAMEEKSYPAVLAGADEICVEAFLEGKIKINEIHKTLKNILNNHEPIELDSIDKILDVVKNTHKITQKIINERRF